MNTASTWGRRETIVWPPHAPIYFLSTLAIALMATVGFVWQHFAFSQSTLQRSYTTTYIRASAQGKFMPRGSYRLIYVGGGKKPPRLALPADFVDGETVMPDGNTVPIVLSEAAKKEGYRVFYRAPERSYANLALSTWLRMVFFDGKGMLQTYAISLIEGAGFLVIALPFAVGADVRRYKELKYGRRLKGPVMLTPRQFNKTLAGAGLGIRTGSEGTILRLPRSAEPKHIQIMGDTGAGKSTLLMQLLQQIADRGDVAIVYDPAGEFTQRFYRPERGDWILNPLDVRSPYWSPASELRTPAEARTIAASLYQPTDDKKGEFFTQTPQKIFAHLLKYRPTPEQLVAWMSDEDEIDRRVQGTELASILSKGAQQQRSGVLASLGLVADSLRLLPTKEQANDREWSATEWADKREGWVFLTSTEAEQEALRPLHSLWIDLLIRLLTTPKPDIVVQVAIIRPGPIVGKMMNPYMERRQGRQAVTYPHPLLEPVLHRTLGVPLFQEQLLRIAMTIADFTGGEAEELRRALGSRRSADKMRALEIKLREGMDKNQVGAAAQEEIIQSIRSFALYGFPESHAASFAQIAYASAWLKFHYLAAFTAAILNNQPMGFYSAAVLVKDAQRHGLRVKSIDVMRSSWPCTLEREDNGSLSLRLGLRYARGLRESAAAELEAARVHRAFASIEELARRVPSLTRADLATLAEVGALNFIGEGSHRRDALWQVQRAGRRAGRCSNPWTRTKTRPRLYRS